MTRTQEILLSLVNEHGLDKTLELTSLTLYQLILQLDEYFDFPSLEDDEMQDVLLSLFSDTDLLVKKYKNFELSWDAQNDYFMVWKYENETTGEIMSSLVTPFYEGPFIPVDTTYYSFIDSEGNRAHDYEEKFTNLNINKNKIVSLNSIIDWFNTTYIKEVYRQLTIDLKIYRHDNNVNVDESVD